MNVFPLVELLPVKKIPFPICVTPAPNFREKHGVYLFSSTLLMIYMEFVSKIVYDQWDTEMFLLWLTCLIWSLYRLTRSYYPLVLATPDAWVDAFISSIPDEKIVWQLQMLQKNHFAWGHLLSVVHMLVKHSDLHVEGDHVRVTKATLAVSPQLATVLFGLNCIAVKVHNKKLFLGGTVDWDNVQWTEENNNLMLSFLFEPMDKRMFWIFFHPYSFRLK